MKKIPDEIKILSLGFFVLFLGYNGVQQYLTIYFSKLGFLKVGFYCLILIYLFFLFGNFLAPFFVLKFGPKKSLLISSIFYFLFILSLLSKNQTIIYIFSIFLGIFASFLWMAQTSFLIRKIKKEIYGKSSGFFQTFLSLGSGLGIFIFGALIEKFGYFIIPFLILIYSFFPLIAIFLFFQLKEIKFENFPKNKFNFLKKAFLSKTALKFSLLGFSGNLVFGLTIGILPLQIEQILGIFWVGILMSLFSLFPVLFSFFFGKISDFKGRERIIFGSFILRIISFLFLIFPKPVFLISGIFLLAFSFVLVNSIAWATIGDITTEKNLEFLNSLFNFFAILGVIFALFIGAKFSVKIIYLISILTTLFTILVLFPLLKEGLERVKFKIAKEINL